MRYYNIVLSQPNGGAQVLAFTSFAGGKTLPGALNVEIDIFSAPYARPVGGSFVRIWGIPLAYISQAKNLTGLDCTVYAGMQKGLPLANPAQAGIIAQGQVYQPFGNWVGTDMTLDLLLQPYVGTLAKPANLSISWAKGTSLSQAIQRSLQTAYPGFKLNINISPKLVLAYDEHGFYSGLAELSQWIQQKSQDIVGGTYPGVSISINQKTINVYDGTSQKTPKAILFQDLVGQPTWIDAPQIQFKTVMRADIPLGGYVTLPKTLATTTPGSAIGTPARNSASFQGSFLVTLVRHVGNFRQPTGDAWVSIFNATPTQQNLQTGALSS